MPTRKAPAQAAPFAFASAFAAAFALGAVGCVPRGQMCGGTAECGSGRACVAGRCQVQGVVPAIQTARRLVAEPVEVAYVRRGAGPSEGRLPTVARLGDARAEAAVLLRFALPIARGASLVEAYLLLNRVDVALEGSTSLYLARILEPWDARSTSWAVLPRLGRAISPRTRVVPGGPTALRIDARALVLAWMQERNGRDFGVAVRAEEASEGGVAVRLAPGLSPRLSAGVGGSEGLLAVDDGAPQGDGAVNAGARLELYVK